VILAATMHAAAAEATISNRGFDDSRIETPHGPGCERHRGDAGDDSRTPAEYQHGDMNCHASARIHGGYG
jgi:hypothetical protein